MMLSDFIEGNPNTHTLLYRLFASEIGLLSVAHPGVQFEALAQACPSLKQSVMASLGSAVTVTLVMQDYSEVAVEILGRDEAHLFIELYKGLELVTGGIAFADEYSQSVTLAQLVYPMTARAIEAYPALADAVARQLTEHMEKYGNALRQRVLVDLAGKFRFSPAFCARFSAIEGRTVPASEGVAP